MELSLMLYISLICTGILIDTSKQELLIQVTITNFVEESFDPGSGLSFVGLIQQFYGFVDFVGLG